MNWHYVEQGQQVGPVSDEQLAELVRAGRINADTLVWCGGMADWLPYGQVQAKPKPPEMLAGSVETARPAAAGNATEAVCNECGNIFPVDEMIRHGNARICANCKPVFMQKLSEGAQINTGELHYARILTRFAALVLDGLILGATNVLIGLIAGLSVAQAAGVQPKGAVALQVVLFAIQLTIGISYETIMIGKYGATLGKMACKIKVVTADGGRVSYARALGRYFAKMLSGMICLIGYIIAIFDKPQRRALHDHICNTRVVYK
ncbi:MAG TPA: RDD family protein [Verrucomicrobiae bacterium]